MAQDLYRIPLRRIDGTPSTLGDFEGQVLLIVNVASKCGLTPQYEGLEKIYETYRARGFSVLGFPANDFAGQEPGTNDEIQTFCQTRYNVAFPLFEKISVKGEARHPLYQALIAAQPTRTAKAESALAKILTERGLGPERPTDIMWNFEKFLVGRDGAVLGRFAPDIPPEDPLVSEAIEGALGRA